MYKQLIEKNATTVCDGWCNPALASPTLHPQARPIDRRWIFEESEAGFALEKPPLYHRFVARPYIPFHSRTLGGTRCRGLQGSGENARATPNFWGVFIASFAL